MDGNVEREASNRQEIDDPPTLVERAGRQSLDGTVSALGNESRRATIDSMITASEQSLEFETLVDRVADRLRDDADRVSDEQRQRIRIALHHNHLPHLADAGIVTYETDTKDVTFVGDGLEQELLTLITSVDA